MMIWSDMTLIMINWYQVVKTDLELFAAAIFGSRIYIAFDDLKAGNKYVAAYGGNRNVHNIPYHLRLGGIYYSRNQFEFRVLFSR